MRLVALECDEVSAVEILDHHLFEVRLACFEKTIQLVQLGQLDNLQHFMRARGFSCRLIQQPLVVVQVHVVYNLSESFIANLSVEIND